MNTLRKHLVAMSASLMLALGAVVTTLPANAAVFDSSASVANTNVSAPADVTTGTDGAFQCYVNGSNAANVAIGGQITYTFTLPAGATNTSYTYMTDRAWGNNPAGVENAWTPTNGVLDPGQAGIGFTLKGKTFVGGVYQECVLVVQGLNTGESGVTPTSGSLPYYSKYGNCPRTIRTTTTSSGANQVDHFYQCSTSSEVAIANFLENEMREGLRIQSLARQNILNNPSTTGGANNSLSTWLLNNGADVSASVGGNRLATNLRAVAGFVSFAVARAAASSNSVVFLNCSGTVSTGSGSCAIVVQFSDPVTLKSVTIQTGSITVASAGSAVMGMAKAEADHLETMGKNGKLAVSSDQLTLPEAPKPELPAGVTYVGNTIYTN